MGRLSTEGRYENKRKNEDEVLPNRIKHRRLKLRNDSGSSEHIKDTNEEHKEGQNEDSRPAEHRVGRTVRRIKIKRNTGKEGYEVVNGKIQDEIDTQEQGSLDKNKNKINEKVDLEDVGKHGGEENKGKGGKPQTQTQTQTIKIRFTNLNAGKEVAKASVSHEEERSKIEESNEVDEEKDAKIQIETPKRRKGRPPKIKRKKEMERQHHESDSTLGDGSVKDVGSEVGLSQIGSELGEGDYYAGTENMGSYNKNEEPGELPRPRGIQRNLRKQYDLNGDLEKEEEWDEDGEKKIDKKGNLLGGREYIIPTFKLPTRRDPEKVYMLAAHVCRLAGLRDLAQMVRTYPMLTKYEATPEEREILLADGWIYHTMKNRTIGLVEARSLFRTLGSLAVKNGRYITDDYWEKQKREEAAMEEGALVNTGGFEIRRFNAAGNFVGGTVGTPTPGLLSPPVRQKSRFIPLSKMKETNKSIKTLQALVERQPLVSLIDWPPTEKFDSLKPLNTESVSELVKDIFEDFRKSMADVAVIGDICRQPIGVAARAVPLAIPFESRDSPAYLESAKIAAAQTLTLNKELLSLRYATKSIWYDTHTNTIQLPADFQPKSIRVLPVDGNNNYDGDDDDDDDDANSSSTNRVVFERDSVSSSSKSEIKVKYDFNESFCNIKDIEIVKQDLNTLEFPPSYTSDDNLFVSRDSEINRFPLSTSKGQYFTNTSLYSLRFGLDSELSNKLHTLNALRLKFKSLLPVPPPHQHQHQQQQHQQQQQYSHMYPYAQHKLHLLSSHPNPHSNPPPQNHPSSLSSHHLTSSLRPSVSSASLAPLPLLQQQPVYQQQQQQHQQQQQQQQFLYPQQQHHPPALPTTRSLNKHLSNASSSTINTPTATSNVISSTVSSTATTTHHNTPTHLNQPHAYPNLVSRQLVPNFLVTPNYTFQNSNPANSSR